MIKTVISHRLAGMSPLKPWQKNSKLRLKSLALMVLGCLVPVKPPFLKATQNPNFGKRASALTTSTQMPVTVWHLRRLHSCVLSVWMNRWVVITTSKMPKLLCFGVPTWRKCTRSYGPVLLTVAYPIRMLKWRYFPPMNTVVSN